MNSSVWSFSTNVSPFWRIATNSNGLSPQQQHKRQMQQQRLQQHRLATTTTTISSCRSQTISELFLSNGGEEESLTAIRSDEIRNSNNNNNNNNDNDDDNGSNQNNSAIWNPALRRIMGGAASLGALETAYLTYVKMNGGDIATTLLCSDTTGSTSTSSCGSVLDSAYAVIPFTENVPLTLLGLVAYVTTGLLAVAPILFNNKNNEVGEIDNNDNDDDTNNRVLLTAITTTMGTFSIFLMSILFGVLQTSCTYCIVSAVLSIGLAMSCWFGGCLPLSPSSSSSSSSSKGLMPSVGGFVTAVVASVILFFNVDDTVSARTQFVGSPGAVGSGSSVLLAAAGGQAPPPITTTSSERALTLSNDLAILNARMYGAYWCSHCYDQKEALGKEAFAKIQYIECSKDGLNSQKSLCKEKDIPGYPTWEINGKFFPGEQELEELEDIVQQNK